MLAPQTRLGPYEIVAPLGAGAMGEVYRARDSRLQRQVAIKILPPSLADEERMHRFQTEAKAASALNHPNIITVFDIGVEQNTHYLVTELIDGEPLRQLVNQAPIPARQLLDIAVQVADGLSAAHAAGITHRDLKPENIMLTPEGRVKILDFGLAKAETKEIAPDEATVVARRTDAGTIMGTLGYMSPEQARGLNVDFRTDQFALGTIIYELAAGTTPFLRDTTADTLAAILKEEPEPVRKLNPKLPAPIAWIVERLHAKDPAQRYDSTRDLFRELRHLRDHLSDATPAAAEPMPIPVPPAKHRIPAGIGLLAGGLLAGAGLMAAVFLLAPAAPPLTYTPFAIEAEAEDRPAWSPDGKSIAYLKPVDQRPQVFVRALDSTAAAQLTKGAAFVTTVFWAPDGARIYFVSANTLFAISPAGGPAQKIAGDALSAAISPDGNHFVYLSWERRHAMTQPVNGGPAVPYYPKETLWTGVAARMQFAADGKRVFFNARQGATAEEAEFRLLEFPFPAAGGPRSLHLPPALTPGISDASLASISWLPDSRHFLTSGIFPGQFSSNLYLADSRSGKVRALTSGPGNATSPVVSRDGRRAAFIVGERSRNIVEFALPSTAGAEIPLRKILASATEESDPMWSPDGAALAYSATVAGSMNRIFVRSADGAWTRSLTLECDPGESLTEPRISPDGQRVAVEVRSQARHIIAVASISGGKLVPIDTVSRHQHNPRWSPDGNWLVYDAEVDNHLKTIFKAPIGGLGKPVPLARSPHNAQAQYVWLPDGNSILAIAPRDMYRIPANGGEPERIGDGSRTHTFDPRTQTIWLVKDGTAGRVELIAWQPATNLTRAAGYFNLPPTAALRNINIHPDGKRFAATLEENARDIWILDGLRAPSFWSWWK